MSEQDEKDINCPICGEKAKKRSFANTSRIDCPICHEFNIGDAFNIPKFNEEEQIKLRYYYYTLDMSDDIRLKPITNDNKEEFLSSIISPESLLEKMDSIIKHLSDNTKYYGEPVKISRFYGYRKFFCKDRVEFEKILNDLHIRNYIEIVPPTPDEILYNATSESLQEFIVTTDGFKYAQKLSNTIDSKQCFVAMWFDPSTENLYNKIYKAVTGNPLLEKNDKHYGANYKIMKIDDKHHTNYIPAEIIAEIKRSRFMIADLTGYRGGVYYEAGYADGLGIPVILTCHEKWFNDQKDKDGNIIINGVHFDLKQKNILFWTEETLEHFQRNLVARIGEVVGYNNTSIMGQTSNPKISSMVQ